MKKVREQQTDADYLRLLERAGNFAQRNVRGDERYREFSTCQTHREFFYAAALGKKFGLSRESESDFVHPCFVNWPGHNSIELAAASERDRFFKCSCGGARRFGRRFA